MSELFVLLRHAGRRLRRSPGFSVIALATMAAGVAACVGVFGVLRAVVLDPLPFEDSAALRWIHAYPEAAPETRLELSHPDFRDLRSRTDVFARLAAFPTAEGRRVWEADGAVAAVRAARVTGGYFDVLGAAPLLGRVIAPTDDVPGAAPVVVLSWRAWQGRLGGAADVLGRVVRLDGEPYTVVGVMPRAFADPAGGEVWTALVPAVGGFAENRNVGFLHVIGRLRPGVTDAAAAAGTSRILADLAALHGPPGLVPVARLEPLRDALHGSARGVLFLLSAAAVLVLLLTCVNLAAMLLASGVTRSGEIAMRAALGASRRRLIRELAAEALLLGLGAAVLGTWAAAVGLDAFAGLMPADLYRGDAVRVDAPVVAFAFALSAAAALLFGSVAAFISTRRRVIEGTSPAARVSQGRQARRAGRILMGAQVAIAAVVLVAGGLIGRSFLALRSADTGFDTEEVLSFELFLPNGPDAAEVAAIHERLRDRLRGLPGVDGAASVLLRPLEGPEGYDYPFTVEGLPAEAQAANPFLSYESVTPAYFATVGIPIITGRAFTDADGADGPPVVIVSETVERRFFPDGNAVGRRLRWGGPGGTGPWLTVVGVAGAARYRGMSEVSLDVYVPHAQAPWPLRFVVLRMAADPAPVFAALPRLADEVAPGAHVIRPATLDRLVDDAVARPRFQASVFGLFALLGLLLAGAGTFGVVAHFTSRRVRELGIRLALGAHPRGLGRLVVGEAVKTGLIGVSAGLVLAAFAARGLASMIWGVPVLDTVTFVVAAAVLVSVTGAAALPSALRAMRIEPNLVLRRE